MERRERAQRNGVSVSSLALNRHERIKRCDALLLEANGITRATRDTLGDRGPCTNRAEAKGRKSTSDSSCQCMRHLCGHYNLSPECNYCEIHFPKSFSMPAEKRRRKRASRTERPARPNGNNKKGIKCECANGNSERTRCFLSGRLLKTIQHIVGRDTDKCLARFRL